MKGTQFLKQILIVCVGSLLYAIAMNIFLTPAGIFASGVAGISQLITTIGAKYFEVHLSTGMLIFLINIPIVYLSWKMLGKRFTFFSALSVLVLTLALEVIPVRPLQTDLLLNAIFGGIVGAVGVGYTLKYGASLGGFDVIAMIASFKKGKSFGTYSFGINGVIVLAAGFFNGWQEALYTIISLYAATRVIDAIYTSHVKVTVFIVTKKPKDVSNAIFGRMVRGTTVMPAFGGYTDEEKSVLMCVITRYELYDLKRVVDEVDPQAFTNVVETADVFGNFLKKSSIN